MKPTLSAVFAVLVLVGCASSDGLRPAQRMKNYPDLRDRAVPERVAALPTLLRDDLAGTDSTTGYRNHPLTADERAVFESTLAQLPEVLHRTLQTEVYGIYFVGNFSGGGMTYYVWRDGQAKFLLIFNPETLHRSLSDWLTYRDNTALVGEDSGYSLRETEPGEHVGFLHTLIHESLHVYDFSHAVTQDLKRKLTPASLLGWQGQLTLRPEREFPVRSRLSFYNFEGKPKVPIAELNEGFGAFAASGFASLYGSWNSMDEFAENETYFLLKERFGIVMTLEVLKDERVVNSFVPSASPAVLARYAQYGELR